MKSTHLRLLTAFVLACAVLLAVDSHAQRQMENLGRGVVAIHQGGGKVFVSWRLPGTEPEEIAFNVYRQSGDGRGLFSTGLRHGDALHVGDLDLTRPGLEVFGIHKNEEATGKFGTPGLACYDAKTGKILWSFGPGADVGVGFRRTFSAFSRRGDVGGASGLRTAGGERIGVALARRTLPSGGTVTCCGSCSTATAFPNGTGKRASSRRC